MRETRFRWARLGVVASVVAAALVPAPASAAAAIHDWSRRLGGPSYDAADSIAVDASGALILAGSTDNYSIELGGGPLLGSGNRDIVLAKFSSSGAHLWSKRLGAPGYDFAESVAVDASDAMILAGRTNSASIDLGGGPLPGAGQWDIVLAKFSSSGAHLWSRRLGGSNDDYPTSVAVDASGAMILAGSTNSASIDLGGGPLPGSGNLDADIVLAKFSSSGAHEWSKRLGGPGNDAAESVAVDASGAVLVAASTISTTTDLGGGSLTGSSLLDIVLAKYSSSGAHLWSKRQGGTNHDQVRSVAVDASGAVFVAAWTASPSIDLGGGPLPGSGDGGSDVVVARFSASGGHLWSKRLGGPLDDLASSVAVDASGEVLVAGTSSGSWSEMGGGELGGRGESDIVLAKFSPSGTHLWSERVGGSGRDVASWAVVDATGVVYLAARSDSPSIDLGGGPLPGSGDDDMLLARYEWDGTPPVSEMQPVQVGAGVTGTATDDLTGVEGVTVVYTNLVTDEAVVAEATLVCDPPRLSCSFSDAGPGLGVWRVNARARDRAANVEIPDSMSTLIATT